MFSFTTLTSAQDELVSNLDELITLQETLKNIATQQRAGNFGNLIPTDEGPELSEDACSALNIISVGDLPSNDLLNLALLCIVSSSIEPQEDMVAAYESVMWDCVHELAARPGAMNGLELEATKKVWETNRELH